MSIATLAGAVILAAAFVTSLVALWKYLFVGGYRFLRKNGERVENVDTLPELHTKVDRIEDTLSRLEPLITTMNHEMHPNSGMSMKDQVTRIEQNLSAHISNPNAH